MKSRRKPTATKVTQGAVALMARKPYLASHVTLRKRTLDAPQVHVAEVLDTAIRWNV